MIQYIYFVKCPDCEDEHFDFFNDAKDYAVSCLSKKPIITQIEVDRNDFGECVDSQDLGTIWSWEDMAKVTDAEPAVSIFTKDDLKALDSDPEFDSLDNSLDFVPDNFRKPVPADMSIDALVEEMEENEDTVECKWCEDLFDKSECRYEVDLGWLCGRCEAAIKSRGETLTFRESLVDEAIEIPADVLANCVDFSDFEIWGVESVAGNRFKAILLKRIENVDCHSFDEMQKVTDEMYTVGGLFTFSFLKDGSPELNSWNVKLLNKLTHCEIEFEDDRYEAALKVLGKSKNESLEEAAPKRELIDLEYDNLTITLAGNQRDADDWDEVEYTNSFSYSVDKDDVATVIWENFITDEDVIDVPGGLETLEDDAAWNEFLETHFDTLFEKYYNEILKHYEDDAVEAFETSYSWSDYQADMAAEKASQFEENLEFKSMLEELEDSETYRKRLTLCPECGTDSFDTETGICINCGFN